jgi:hypothetical protein
LASTALTRTYNTFLTLTLDAMRKSKVADQVHKGVRMLDWCETSGKRKDSGGFRYEDGGALIRIPVIWRKNQTAGSYRGFDPIDVTPQDPITAVFEDWGENADAIAISRRDLRLNSGPRGWLKLLDQQVDVAVDSLREEVNRQLVAGTISGSKFIQGNNSKDMIPLPMLIGYKGTVGGSNANQTPGASLHQVNPESETWWKNQFDECGGAMGFAELRRRMQRVYTNCKKGSKNDGPDLILADQYSWECYERSIYSNQRFPGFGIDTQSSSPGIADDGLKYRNAMVLWDEFVPDVYTPALDPITNTAGTMFFINTRWICFVVDTESHFVTSPFREPHNQTAIYSKVVLMSQMTIEQRRKCGVLYRIKHDATAE